MSDNTGSPEAVRRLAGIYSALENPDIKYFLDTRIGAAKDIALMNVVDAEIESVGDLVRLFTNLGALRRLHELEKEFVDVVKALQLEAEGRKNTEANPTEPQPEVP